MSGPYKEGYDFCNEHGPPYKSGTTDADDWRAGMYRALNQDEAEHRGKGG